jgi:hypothetical protein
LAEHSDLCLIRHPQPCFDLAGLFIGWRLDRCDRKGVGWRFGELQRNVEEIVAPEQAEHNRLSWLALRHPRLEALFVDADAIEGDQFVASVDPGGFAGSARQDDRYLEATVLGLEAQPVPCGQMIMSLFRAHVPTRGADPTVSKARA